MSLLQKILNLGTTSEDSPLGKEHIRITNAINLLLIFFVGIPPYVSIISLTTDGIESYSRFFLLVGFSTTALLLNRFNYTKLSKIITSVYPPMVLIFFPILINHFIHAGMFLWLPYGLMTLGIIPFFIFSFEKEKVLMCTIILFYIVTILGFDEYLIDRFNHLTDLDFIKKYHFYYFVTKSIISFFLYASFFFFKYRYHINRIKLSELTAELNEKNQILNSLNTTLETKVIERTAQLTLQNERIKKLAYTNAHEIRAHVLRIKGLLNISKLETSQEEHIFYREKVTENILALENITIQISKDLIEEE